MAAANADKTKPPLLAAAEVARYQSLKYSVDPPETLWPIGICHTSNNQLCEWTARHPPQAALTPPLADTPNWAKIAPYKHLGPNTG